MAKTTRVGNLHIDNNLANFLTEEGVLQEFIEESKRLTDWDGEDGSIDSIVEAFQWSLSRRGFKFWSLLEMKYLENIM